MYTNSADCEADGISRERLKQQESRERERGGGEMVATVHQVRSISSLEVHNVLMEKKRNATGFVKVELITSRDTNELQNMM